MEPFKKKTMSEFTEESKKGVCPNGIYSDIPHDLYNDAKGTRRSDLVNLLRSAKFYNYRQSNPMQGGSPALAFGSAFHTAVLEPDKWEGNYVVGPDVSKATKVWKNFVLDNEDKQIVSAKDMEIIEGMLQSIHGNEFAMSFIKGQPVEESAWAVINGKEVKARSDIVMYDQGILVDVKTTQDASPHEFQRSAYKYKYDVQAAYYLDTFNAATPEGVKFDKFVFVAIEKSAPYDIQVYVADPTFVETGRTKYEDALSLLIECEESGVWPGYEQTVLNLTLPRWAQS